VLALTFDIDWAPDPVFDDTLRLLDEYGIEATIFSTHNDSFEIESHERAIHPNFRQSEPFAEVISELKALYPSAIGIRSHSLHVNTPIRTELFNQGLSYESNHMAFEVEGLVPYQMPSGLIQFPIYWMDAVWLRSEQSRVSIRKLLEKPGLKVLTFHPQHIYFNSPNYDYYRQNKDEYYSKEADLSLRYDGYGTRDIFLETLEYISGNALQPELLEDLLGKFRDDLGQMSSV
jgi:hypothetical protein